MDRVGEGVIVTGNGWRTIVIDKHERLELRNNHIVLDDSDGEIKVPLEQLRDVMLSYPSGSITLQLLRRLADEQINVVLCDERREPIAQLMSLNRHSEAAGRLMEQAEWTAKRKDAVWKQIVKQKIALQAALLGKMHAAEEKTLLRYCRSVRLGDRSNREAIAAKVYFPAVFGDGFIRHAADPVNDALDYGYTILNTAMSRILVSHGYNPALGLHHCGRNNPVNLSCDLMEPFRPFVDETVRKHGGSELDWPFKQELIGVTQEACLFDGKHYRIGDAMEAFAGQALEAMQGERKQIGGVAFA